MILKGITEGGKLKLILARQWYQEAKRGEYCMLSHCLVMEEEDKQN